jgi:beta-glucosidase
MWRRWDAETAMWTELGSAGELIVARGLGDIKGRIPLI